MCTKTLFRIIVSTHSTEGVLGKFGLDRLEEGCDKISRNTFKDIIRYVICYQLVKCPQ